MRLRDVLLFNLLFIGGLFGYGQNSIDLKAKVDVDIKTIHIEQRIIYQNQSNDTLNTVKPFEQNNLKLSLF